VVKKVRFVETKRGHHFWFHIGKAVGKELDDRRKAELQFLLGDDIVRAKYNFMREELDAFDSFNALFSEKSREELGLRKLLLKWLKNQLEALLGVS